jgi:post-segregation antitoxin (ccd killing protein)
MAGKTSSFYLPKDLAEYAEREDVNVSEIAQEALRNHRRRGDEAALREEISEKEIEVEQKRAELETVESELEELQERLAEIKERKDNRKETVRDEIVRIIQYPIEVRGSPNSNPRLKQLEMAELIVPYEDVYELVEEMDLHHYDSDIETFDGDLEEARDALSDAGVCDEDAEVSEIDYYSDDAAEVLSGLLPREREAFEEGWEERFE